MAAAITTIVEDDVLARLDALAGDATRETLVAEAVRRFVDDRAALVAFVGQGAASIAGGRGIGHKAFVSAVDAWRDDRGIGRKAGGR